MKIFENFVEIIFPKFQFNVTPLTKIFIATSCGRKDRSTVQARNIDRERKKGEEGSRWIIKRSRASATNSILADPWITGSVLFLSFPSFLSHVSRLRRVVGKTITTKTRHTHTYTDTPPRTPGPHRHYREWRCRRASFYLSTRPSTSSQSPRRTKKKKKREKEQKKKKDKIPRGVYNSSRTGCSQVYLPRALTRKSHRGFY